MRPKGFTLIELLVVIAIIAVLAAIIIPNLTSGSAAGRDSARISQLRQIKYALEIYFNENGRYPTCLYIGVPAGCTAATSLQGSSAMATVPKDPKGANYNYTAFGSGANCSSYHLGTSLEVLPNTAVLGSDADKVRVTTGFCGTVTPVSTATTPTDFHGTSPGTGTCGTTAGTSGALPTGTERCYDLVP